MAKVTDLQWQHTDGSMRTGFYMDRWLKNNLDGIPFFISKKYDVVGIVSGTSKVRLGKSLSSSSKITLVDKNGLHISSKPLKEYKDGEILNVLSYDFTKNELIEAKAEVIKELDEKDFYTVETEDGRRVTCSMDHKFFVKCDGKIKVLLLKEIKEGDEIQCLDPS